jgi:mono/diheme cytochrome c family protein
MEIDMNVPRAADRSAHCTGARFLLDAAPRAAENKAMPHRLSMGLHAALLLTFVAAGAAHAAAPHVDEGEAALLYDTHCRACHTEQVHWRQGKLVTDWPSLVRQVDRWQRNLGLGWTDADVRVVAHYLNLRFYRFPPAAPRVIAQK